MSTPKAGHFAREEARNRGLTGSVQLRLCILHERGCSCVTSRCPVMFVVRRWLADIMSCYHDVSDVQRGR